jgi:hypothetical protein
MMLKARVPLAEAARRLGHSVETLVSTYVGAMEGDDAEANALLDVVLAATRERIIAASHEPAGGADRQRPSAARPPTCATPGRRERQLTSWHRSVLPRGAKGRQATTEDNPAGGRGQAHQLRPPQ